MKKLDSSLFYTEEWSQNEEIVLDEMGIVYIRRKDEDMDSYFSPLSMDTTGDAFSKERPNEFQYNLKAPIMCICGNKQFEIFQPKGEYETNAECTKCKRLFCAHLG